MSATPDAPAPQGVGAHADLYRQSPSLACQVMRLASQLLVAPWGLEPAVASAASWKVVLGTSWPQLPAGL